MLNIFTRKLCPLLSLALATMGCGKKITESEKSDIAIRRENQELPGALILKLNTTESSSKTYTIQRNGNITFPDALLVRQGNAVGKTVTITYNFTEEDEDSYTFKCKYRSNEVSSELPLVNCEDIDGAVFGNPGFHEFPIYYGKTIKMELQDSANNLVIDAIYNVDWVRYN